MIHFEQFELDDLAAHFEDLAHESVEELINAKDLIVGYEVRLPDSILLCEFLNRVVETADKNRARKLKNSLDNNPARAHNRPRSIH